MSTHAFTYINNAGILTAIDAVQPQTGLSYWFGKSQAQLEQEYGATVTVMTWDEYDRQTRARIVQPPSEITKEEFWNALEVLPPDDWQRHGATESFKMCEHMSGTITGIYARIGDRYFAMMDDCHLTHDAIIAACKAFASAEEAAFATSFTEIGIRI